MNELHKAYQALGLEPGALFDTIKRRYRRLALVWHPDRMTNAEAKREAEEELKKINNYFEKLKKHFETEHTSGPGCRCKPAAAGPPPNNAHNTGGGQKANTKSGTTEAEKKRQEEEAARKRTAERERQTAETEAARRAAEAAEAAQRVQEKHKAAEDAVKGESDRKEEVLRWKCSVAVGVAFIGLIAYCWVGCAARDVAHGVGKQWDEFQSQFKPKEPAPVSPSYQPPEQPAQRYIPPYERFPGGNPTSWQQFHDELEQRHQADQEKQQQQDIYFAKLQVDRAQRTIDHCSHDIAQMDLKLSDPFVSEFEKNKIREMRDFQQRNLDAAQAELRDAQNKLNSSNDNSPLGQPEAPPAIS